jgi:opacity protein-like surface antigen
MKKIFLLTTALLLTIAAVAADKVIQTSSRRAPKWIGGVEEGYIIVSADAFTLELAKDKQISYSEGSSL